MIPRGSAENITYYESLKKVRLFETLNTSRIFLIASRFFLIKSRFSYYESLFSLAASRFFLPMVQLRETRFELEGAASKLFLT